MNRLRPCRIGDAVISAPLRVAAEQLSFLQVATRYSLLATLIILSANALAVELKPGEPIPAFSLPRADGTPGEFASEQLKGRPTAIVFWRPNQQLSTDALRDLRAVVDEVGPDKLHVVAVDTAQSSPEQVRDALAGEDLPFPILLDPQRELYGRVGVIVSPTTLMFDAKGELRFRAASHPRQFQQVIRARLRYLLGEINEEEMNREIEPTVLSIDHDLAAAWRMYNLGRKLQSEGKPVEAIAVYEKAVTQYPALSEARCALGFMKLSAGDVQAAAQHFQTAMTYDPTFPTARLGQASVLARTGEPQRAEEILLPLLGHPSVAVRVRYELGRIYHARGEIDTAVTFYEDALRALFPETGGTDVSPVVRDTATETAVPEATLLEVTDNGRPLSVPPPIAIPPDARFVGVTECKKCHFQQWKSWQTTRMAQALDLLKPGERAEAKAARGLDPQTDYGSETRCLPCHTTGFGHAGGYQPSATQGFSRPAEGVSCESCHGPGSAYVAIHKDIQDNRRTYTQQELYESGQYPVDARVCVSCHTQSAPCIAPGYVFDFEQRKQDGTHRHYDLQFRAE
jgi:tetratricopeptide (TPR) repeat protein